MYQNEKPQVRLWSDSSPEAQQLEEKLTECGYEVDNFFSGSAKPTAFYQGQYSSGFSEIGLDLCSNPPINNYSDISKPIT